MGFVKKSELPQYSGFYDKEFVDIMTVKFLGIRDAAETGWKKANKFLDYVQKYNNIISDKELLKEYRDYLLWVKTFASIVRNYIFDYNNAKYKYDKDQMDLDNDRLNSEDICFGGGDAIAMISKYKKDLKTIEYSDTSKAAFIGHNFAAATMTAISLYTMAENACYTLREGYAARGFSEYTGDLGTRKTLEELRERCAKTEDDLSLYNDKFLTNSEPCSESFYSYICQYILKAYSESAKRHPVPFMRHFYTTRDVVLNAYKEWSDFSNKRVENLLDCFISKMDKNMSFVINIKYDEAKYSKYKNRTFNGSQFLRITKQEASLRELIGIKSDKPVEYLNIQYVREGFVQSFDMGLSFSYYGISVKEEERPKLHNFTTVSFETSMKTRKAFYALPWVEGDSFSAYGCATYEETLSKSSNLAVSEKIDFQEAVKKTLRSLEVTNPVLYDKLSIHKSSDITTAFVIMNILGDYLKEKETKSSASKKTGGVISDEKKPVKRTKKDSDKLTIRETFEVNGKKLPPSGIVEIEEDEDGEFSIRSGGWKVAPHDRIGFYRRPKNSPKDAPKTEWVRPTRIHKEEYNGFSGTTAVVEKD
jgi:hypothetical protein